MTEEEWLTRPAPLKLLEHLEERKGATERKLRLFAATCCRRVQRWFIDPCQHQAVDMLERFADGTAGPDDLEAVALVVQQIDELDPRLNEDNQDESSVDLDVKYHAAEVVSQATCIVEPGEGNPTLFHRAHDVVQNTVDAMWFDASLPDVVRDRMQDAVANEHQNLSVLLRCIFGNPFRPVAFDPRWRTETAVVLAAGIYTERAFDRLPILADALEDAGCDAVELLTHLRGPGPHVRGCWAVDLVLGKE